MKKRIVVLGMVMVMLAGCLTGCKKKTECFYCGEEKNAVRKRFHLMKRYLSVTTAKKN